LIGELWPEALSEPVNPHKNWQPGLRGRVKRVLVKSHLMKLIPRAVIKLAVKIVP